ncbi:ribosome maturation factor RimM [Cellulomonas bogoriensis]|uniref:ribosome maturation factor RimM n=1 Tax=Cellulomonas bogoriensis TaxID=301388 RepID=UPI00055961C5|nr:ribosome maturation factor RimM [Cellulomonas bogoriensis]
MELTVATVGRAQGLRGEVALDVRTDAPDRRLVVGAVLRTDPPGAGPLKVVAVRRAGSRWWVRFAGVEDRTAAEGLRGVTLVVEAGASDEEDAWYPHELVGLRVERPDGSLLGAVEGLEPLPVHDLLLVREPGADLVRVPFVRALVPEVDVEGGRVVVDPPRGLFSDDGPPVVAGPEGG